MLVIFKVNFLESLEVFIWCFIVKKKLSMYIVELLLMEYIFNYLIEEVV